jgi:hypothetical protein
MQSLRDAFAAGLEFAKAWAPSPAQPGTPDANNPLRAYFEAHRQGHGIIKWDHYFEIYHRHLSRFRGQEVHLLEIGVFSGGSLEMWREYLGPRCHIYGVDIQSACKAYESDRVKIFVGDQADRSFWKHVRQHVPHFDVAIDDGGHTPDQQRISFEELLPHLRAGGVYICEDIHDILNPFATFLNGFSHHLNSIQGGQNNPDNPDRRIVCRTSPMQSSISSIHLYPYVAVVERNVHRLDELVAPMRGTQWEPHMK